MFFNVINLKINNRLNLVYIQNIFVNYTVHCNIKLIYGKITSSW